VVERRSSELLSTYRYLTDDSRVHHAASVQLCRAKFKTCFDDRFAVAIFFLTPVFKKIEVPEESILFSVDTFR